LSLLSYLLFSPPENDTFREGLCFAVLLEFIFSSFFSSRNLRAPWADHREILHDARRCVQFYNLGPKFWGSLPKKILEAKNMQIWQGTKRSKIGAIYDNFRV